MPGLFLDGPHDRTPDEIEWAKVKLAGIDLSQVHNDVTLLNEIAKIFDKILDEPDLVNKVAVVTMMPSFVNLMQHHKLIS